ncbi:NmrA family NAD(P)-binding protein [Pontibacter locisalis]|uniref:NmrA family NAD(P)-binding protein n=1 Tax=Pontibacter locisalis TaxID=1719035 RepID=A0ABW5IIZ6_9BACT
MMTQNNRATSGQVIVLAGATGDLGSRIAQSLLKRSANIRAIVRAGSSNDKVTALQKQGATIVEVDYGSASDLVKACHGASCVVSALSGLREVILDVQTKLLDAAVEAGVPRFIPSDFAIDFTKLPYGTNRNLDLRKEFHERLNKALIAPTSILNGMFSDLLTGQAPLVQFGLKKVIYWGDADQLLDFTTMDNTAEYTAAAALDPHTPRYLRIAGDVLNAYGLRDAASEATGKKFGLIRVGGLGVLDTMIKVTKFIIPGNDEVYPPWQGMQYMRNMLSGLPKLEPLDNDRYSSIQWTPVREVLANR